MLVKGYKLGPAIYERGLYCTAIKVTPHLRGATFTEIFFFDHIKANYLNLHLPKKLT